jgi:hypothetical protein
MTTVTAETAEHGEPVIVRHTQYIVSGSDTTAL